MVLDRESKGGEYLSPKINKNGKPVINGLPMRVLVRLITLAQFIMVKRQSSRAMRQFISERQKAEKRRKNEAGRHKEQQIKFIKKMRKSRGYWCSTCL
ncbi:hypothetical protein D172_012315 [Pseudoalteromonas sp. Bsw20308]|nr:hypothetical protein D172_012315 [Pseudoalteromonas sp. Bsw20308]